MPLPTMKTFIFPVVKMASQKGHVRVQAPSLESAHHQALQMTQEQLQRGFKPHYSTSATYEVQPHRHDYQQLLGDFESSNQEHCIDNKE